MGDLHGLRDANVEGAGVSDSKESCMLKLCIGIYCGQKTEVDFVRLLRLGSYLVILVYPN